MDSAKKKKILYIALGIVAAMQLVPLPRDNPPVSGALAAPAEIQPLLERSCYDCHSNQTRWPWYAWVAPVSYLVAFDVHEAREHLNFSEWAALPANKQAHAFEEIVEVIEAGEMPLGIYTSLHPEAKLSDGQRQALIAWAKANGG